MATGTWANTSTSHNERPSLSEQKIKDILGIPTLQYLCRLNIQPLRLSRHDALRRRLCFQAAVHAALISSSAFMLCRHTAVRPTRHSRLSSDTSRASDAARAARATAAAARATDPAVPAARPAGEPLPAPVTDTTADSAAATSRT
jgi:hypothetical protein